MKQLACLALAAALSACTTTTTTAPDGTVTKTRRPDPKTILALRGAVETIGAAAAQQAIREIAAQQEAAR